MKVLIRPQIEIFDTAFCSKSIRQAVKIFAASSRDLTRDMVRVKSSNVWGYNINVRDEEKGIGDVYVQFKGDKGGPGDIYVYYDVPTVIYRRWQSAPSKGHYFWQYLRGKYRYSKLTGDKKTKMRGGVTSPGAIPNRNSGQDTENAQPEQTEQEEQVS